MLKINSPQKFSPEAELVLLVARELGCSKRIVEIKDLINSQDINWEKFKRFIGYHELMPFVYISLKEYSSLLPQDLIEFLKISYYFSFARSLCLWQEFLQILSASKQVGITLLPIKGIALLQEIYIDKPFRPMVDIDVLVKEENLLTAEEMIYGLGYGKELGGLKEKYWRERQCHIAFCKKELSRFISRIDLHWALDFKRRYRQILPQFWTRLREIVVDGMKIKLPSLEDTLFSLALHRRRFGNILCLKNVCDGALLLNRYATNLDWDYILRESKEGKMCSTMFFFLSQIKFLSNVNIPQTVWKNLKVPTWKKKLIPLFIEKRTFSDSVLSLSFYKNLYLKSHFLLYDSFWEPIEYILKIPQEQFAKFYNLNPYGERTKLFYRMRLLYIIYKTISKRNR